MELDNLNFQIKHVGVNCEDDKKAIESANFFEKFFKIPKNIGKDSIYTGAEIEFMKSRVLGYHGHIAVGTDNIYMAKEYLESLGLEFFEDYIKYDEDGSMSVLYLKQEIAGFAVHLLQNKK